MVIAMFNEVQVAVLYPALSCRTKPAGPDGIRRERPHLLSVLEAQGATQVCVPAVRPVVPSLIHQSPRNLSVLPIAKLRFTAFARGQWRAAVFAARRSGPLTLRKGKYAQEWLCARQLGGHSHDEPSDLLLSRQSSRINDLLYRFNADIVSLIGSIIGQNRPRCAGHLVGHREDGHIRWPPLKQRFGPDTLILGAGQYHARAVDQKGAQIGVAAFTDAAELHLTTGATLFGNQADKCRKFAP